MEGNDSLDRFLEAQEDSYQIALEEMKQGVKVSHWMWYVFPQIQGLGLSSVARYYGIENLEEAKRYYEHPVLGKRLLEVTKALLASGENDAFKVFGVLDAMKLRSCMTLFHAVDPKEELFLQVLQRFFGGQKDGKTVNILYQQHQEKYEQSA